MKSVTTPILHRFGFRDVIRWNGVLCVASLIGCALFTPHVPRAVIYAVLFVAGMTRSMNFTCMATLAFADVPASMRASATTLSAMSQQASNAFGVAAAALALGFFQALRASNHLSLGDFQAALFASAALMAIAIAWTWRMPADAGAQLSPGAALRNTRS